MNGNSKNRRGTETNCVSLAVDDLDIGLSLDVPPIPFYALIGALSHHCKITSVPFPPATSVKDFFLHHLQGKYLLLFRNPKRDDGTLGSMHVSALVSGTLHNCTELLLQQPLIEAPEFL
jgi:hypothetical protein